jgi:hypothetical protein
MMSEFGYTTTVVVGAGAAGGGAGGGLVARISLNQYPTLIRATSVYAK